jgi:hypothetical protein
VRSIQQHLKFLAAKTKNAGLVIALWEGEAKFGRKKGKFVERLVSWLEEFRVKPNGTRCGWWVKS